MAGQAHRTPVGQAHALEHHDRLAVPDAQPVRDGGGRRHLMQRQHAAGRFPVVAPDPFGEAGAAAYDVVQHVLRHETAAPLLDPDHPGAGQFFQGAADRMAVDAETGGQAGFRVQLVAGSQAATDDVGPQCVRDLPPLGDAAARRQTVRLRCHRNFIAGWGRGGAHWLTAIAHRS